MRYKNTDNYYGIVHIFMHWSVAALIAILFPLGLVMVGLDYYNPGYHNYPPVHKSLGIILLILTATRMLWILFSIMPTPLSQQRNLAIVAKVVHLLLYLLVGLIGCSGYLISTADGRAIEVFNWFSVPALPVVFANQSEMAGEIHIIAAWGLVATIGLHALGAIKHHIIDKDRTLLRIFGK